MNFRGQRTTATVTLLALLLFNAACASRGRRTPTTIASRPVTASSMPSGYGIQLRLSGSMEVRDGWVYLTAPSGAIRTYQGRAEAWDLVLRAGLATCTGRGEWRVISESRAARLASMVGFTRDSSMLDTTARNFTSALQMDFGIPPGTNLDKTWLVLDMTWPVEGVLATYTMHSGYVLRAGSAPVDPRRTFAVLCT